MSEPMKPWKECPACLGTGLIEESHKGTSWDYPCRLCEAYNRGRRAAFEEALAVDINIGPSDFTPSISKWWMSGVQAKEAAIRAKMEGE